jgi:rsbT antagonist protein RsbS
MAHVPILRQRGYLIATLQSAITDREAQDLQDELMQQVSRYRARGVIVDVTVLDVLDSFAARTLQVIAHTTRLRGAHTVLVGVQPEVAFAMVRLGLSMEHVYTALDLEEGLTFLDGLIRRQGER